MYMVEAGHLDDCSLLSDPLQLTSQVEVKLVELHRLVQHSLACLQRLLYPVHLP